MQNRREFLKSAAGFALAGAAVAPAILNAAPKPLPVWGGETVHGYTNYPYRIPAELGVAMSASADDGTVMVYTGRYEMTLEAASPVVAGQIVSVDNNGRVVPYRPEE